MTTPIFTRTDEGVRIDTPWPPETIASRELIERAEPQWLQRNWRTLSFTLTNGSAVYRIASRGKYPRSYILRRVG